MNKIKTNQELNSCFFEDTYSSKNKSGSITFKDKIYVIDIKDYILEFLYESVSALNVLQHITSPDRKNYEKK